MSRKLDNNYFPLQMARAQQEHLNNVKSYPSDEKLLQISSVKPKPFRLGI